MDDKEQQNQIQKLIDLREKIGGALTGEFLKANNHKGLPLATVLVEKIEEIVEWSPSLSVSALLKPDVASVEDEQFLADNIPHSLSVLADEMKTSSTCVAEDDGTLKAMWKLGAIAYPAYISQSGRGQDKHEATWLPLRLRGTQDYLDAEKMLADEKFLVRKGEECDKHIRTTSGVYRNALDFYSASEILLYGAWQLCLLRGDWSPVAFQKTITEQLQRVRQSTQGKATYVPLLCGFGGVSIENNIEDNDVTIRPYIGELQDSLLSPSGRFGEHRSGEPGFIVEMQQPWGFIHPYDKESPNQGESQELPANFDWDNLRHWSYCLGAAVAAVETGDRIRCHEFQNSSTSTVIPSLRWVIAGDPIYGAKTVYFSRGWPITEGKQPEIGPPALELASIFATITEKPFQVAIRRTVAALSFPRRYEEALLDAVIAWEALSGDCRGSVSMMTTAFLSKLISEESQRRQVRKEMEKIYQRRNSIVHGGVVESHEETKIAKNAAAIVALLAAKSLAKENKHLLGDERRFETYCLD
ncbi:MAG: hypothetical protein GY847_42065 [Proteobacteria bacterium]|nr:hypothetical protein [Pseudomonadota bacterium]